MPKDYRTVLDRPLARYAFAIVVVAASFPLRYALIRKLGIELPPFILSYPAVMLVAILGGLGPGLLATVLVAMASRYLILAPPGNFEVGSTSDVVALSIFCFMGSAISLLAEYNRRNQHSSAAFKEEKVRLEGEEELRKASEDAEREREKQFHTLADSIPQLCWMANADGWIFWYNQRWYEYTGTTAKQMEGWGWQSVHDPDALPTILKQWKNSIETKTSFEMTLPLRSADGVFRSFLTRVTPVKDKNGDVVRWFGTNTDITEIKRAEERIRQLNRTYAVLSDINQTIVREKDPSVLLAAACSIAVDRGKFRMAWIGMVDPATHALRPVASSGVVDGFFDRLDIDLEKARDTIGVAAQCFRSGNHTICNDIERDPLYAKWRDEALRRGYRSSGSFPLKVDNVVVGVFSFYASESGFFVGDELALLDEMAMDISFALEVSRREEERRKAEDLLRESERRYSALFANKINAIAHCRIITDEQGRPIDYQILRINDAYEAIIGIKKSDAEGRRAKEIFPGIEDYSFDYIGVYGKIAIEGGETSFETYFEASGLYFSVYAYNSGSGEFTAIFSEITARKLMEQKLSESEHRLRLFIEHAPVALAMFDTKMRYLYASRRWVSDYGLRDRDLSGRSHYEIFPEVPAQWKDAHRRGLAGEVVSKDADPFERFDGSVQWIRWEIRPWTDADGKIGGIVIFTEDITQRTRAEEALRESKAKMEGIVSSAMDALVSVNEQQRITVFNHAAEKIFQCSAAEAIGTTLDRFIPEALREGHREQIRHFGREGATSRSMTSPAILTAVRLNGEKFPIEATISHVQAEGEKFFTVVLRDLTERRRTEGKLRRSEDQLRALAARLQTAAERERLRIARELHDQLGSVLTGMKMDLAWIVHKHGTDENDWVPLVKDSMKAVDSTISLVRQIATELRPEMLDTAGLGAAIGWETEQFQRRTGILCAVHVPEDPIGFSSDQKIAIFRICQEALTNIARHSQAKHVLVTLAQERTHAILTINDDGVGFIADTNSGSPSLGILGMRERAFLLGAQLRIESAPGHGTTVTLRTPLEDAEVAKQENHENTDC